MKIKILLLIIFFILQFLLSVPYYSGDIKNHRAWGQSILDLGPMGFYEREFPGYAFPNYPPVMMWLFAISLKLYELTNILIWFLNINFPFFPSNLVQFFQWENVQIAYLKLPALLSTIGIAVGLYLVGKEMKVKKKLLYLAPLAFLLNPAVLYLNAIWGQVDLLPIMLLIFALYALQKEKIYWTIFLMSLSLLTKQTVIIFWGIFVIILFKKLGFKVALLSIVSATVLFYLSYLPFHQFSLTWPVELYKTNFNLVAHSTGENAINLWGLLYNFERHGDKELFMFLTLQHWGYLMFGLIFLVILWFFYKKKFTYKRFFIFLFLTIIILFFTLTRMHERYLIPAIVFAAILLPFKKSFIYSFVYFSFLHFINLYRGLYQPDIPMLVSLSNSVLFLNFLVIGYFGFIVYHLYQFIKNE